MGSVKLAVSGHGSCFRGAVHAFGHGSCFRARFMLSGTVHAVKVFDLIAWYLFTMPPGILAEFWKSTNQKRRGCRPENLTNVLFGCLEIYYQVRSQSLHISASLNAMQTKSNSSKSAWKSRSGLWVKSSPSPNSF
jgi:hypothetical protein